MIISEERLFEMKAYLKVVLVLNSSKKKARYYVRGTYLKGDLI